MGRHGELVGFRNLNTFENFLLFIISKEDRWSKRRRGVKGGGEE